MPLSLPLRLTLDGDALISNWNWLRARAGKAACGAAVKADGYGLGAREVVAILSAAGCRDYFVATWAEAEALMPLAWGTSLSVLHGVRAEDMDAATTLPARPVLNTPAQVARWKGTNLPCDVMVDTGMNRLGLSVAEARSGLLDGLAIDTLMSHMACADEPGDAMNARQLASFAEAAAAVPAKRYSLANSAAICLGPDYAFDLTRPGLALYGGVPRPDDEDQQRGLQQVAHMEAQVLTVRTVRAGETVGYNATYRAREDERVAIINLGYADGFLRGFSDAAGAVRCGDEALDIIGRVSMDLVAVRLGAEPAGEGDWLYVDYDLPQAAARSGLSQYELLTGLGARFDRRWL
ncbi:MAG: Alanine racemase [uncultured Sphingomonadaceae bacterium]|uniref:Alanine racemase n=1 Tax=uncultured Sphingomonadaceae bacterium TaxID=169976 RepID=A0A6J4TEK3_9SPHN|nr:MAG: Alanine racemase [uncultured Sphingomonadaceae bacterium]